MEKSEFIGVVGVLFEAFNAEARKERFEAYYLGLSDCDLNEIRKSVLISIRECKFLPTPAELREKILGKPDAEAELAWNEVLKAIALGPYKHVNFINSYINATIRSLGGWSTFVSRFASAEEEKYARIDFMKSYQRLCGLNLSEEACAYLPGLSQVENFQPRIVGNIAARKGQVRI